VENMIEKKKPNIVIFLTDQQGSKMMSCTGNPNIYTPSMDKIAQEGVRFTQAVCSNPVCVPSRFSLFTGQMPSSIGIRCNEDVRTMPRIPTTILENGMGFLLQKAGYKTYYAGKEHLPGFISKNIGFTYICRNEREILAQDSATFLKKDHNDPFLFVVSLINPHDICYMAIDDFTSFSKFVDKLNGKKKRWNNKIEIQNIRSILKDPITNLPPLPDNHQPQENEPEAVRSLFKRQFRQNARENWDATTWRKHRYLYAKLTEKVDAQIGTILNALEEGPHSDDTVVIFTSDHGDHDSSHKLEHKTALYSEAVEVPFIIKWEKILPAGETVPHIINNGLDLLPTVCDIAGITIPSTCSGRSVLPLARGDSVKTNKWMPVESEVGRALWSNEWVYVYYDEGINNEQLYNLKIDPGQTRNFIEEYPEILIECRTKFNEIWPDIHT
jgi:arylsulfatase A-like enzyme